MIDASITAQPAIKGLLFDKDGTLFDYQTTWGPWAMGFISHLSKGDVRLSHQLAAALEFDLRAGRFHPDSHFIAGTTEQVLASVLSIVSDTTPEVIEQFYLESTAQAALAPPVPLAPLMMDFKQRAIKLGIATNDHEAVAKSQLSNVDVLAYFDFIAGFDSGYGAKPEPGMQHAFCAELSLQPKAVAMIGDSLHDLESGQNAGMVTIGVLTGMATREELLPKATVVLNHIGEIPDWLERYEHK